MRDNVIQLMRCFQFEYQFQGQTYQRQVWAADAASAAEQLEAMKTTSKLTGELPGQRQIFF